MIKFLEPLSVDGVAICPSSFKQDLVNLITIHLPGSDNLRHYTTVKYELYKGLNMIRSDSLNDIHTRRTRSN